MSQVCGVTDHGGTGPAGGKGTRRGGWRPRGRSRSDLPAGVTAHQRIVPRKLLDTPWPRPIGPAARIGLAGDVIAALDPTTEADPNAMLVQLLAATGGLLGSRVHLLVGEKRHALRVWTLVVGSTARGKKGTGSSYVLSLLDDVDPAWKACRKAGIASGEAIVHHVRDDRERVRRRRQADGTVIETAETTEGVRDKRLLLLEEEFSRVLRLARMEGSTLSATIREAWDSDTIMTTSKTAPERATGAHVVILGHITPEELRRELRAGEIANGFANRFLFACSRRSKHLSLPPRLDATVRTALVERLRRVRSFVETIPGDAARVELSRAAAKTWSTMKREVEEEAEWAEAAGLVLAKVITRGAPYVLRLAALYAVLGKGLAVEPCHLRAAREVWRYSVESARVIFGDEVEHPDARRVLDALARGEGRRLTRASIHGALGGRRTGDDLTRLRDLLIGSGKIEAYLERTGMGRPTEWWCLRV
jgi:hypothetical protein